MIHEMNISRKDLVRIRKKICSCHSRSSRFDSNCFVCYLDFSRFYDMAAVKLVRFYYHFLLFLKTFLLSITRMKHFFKAFQRQMRIRALRNFNIESFCGFRNKPVYPHFLLSGTENLKIRFVTSSTSVYEINQIKNFVRHGKTKKYC